jgi:hypothetical protein
LELLGSDVLGKYPDIVDLAIQADCKHVLAQKWVQERFSGQTQWFWIKYGFHCATYLVFVVVVFLVTLRSKDFTSIRSAESGDLPDGSVALGVTFIVYLVGLCAQEIEEYWALHTFKRYITSRTGNCLDVVIILMQGIAVVLR